MLIRLFKSHTVYERVDCWRKQQESIKLRCLKEVERLADELGCIQADAGVFDLRREAFPDLGEATQHGCGSTGARISGKKSVLAFWFSDICFVTVGKSTN